MRPFNSSTARWRFARVIRRPWSGAGVALKELEEFDAAEVAFDAALALDPESAHARNNKGVLQLLRGNFRDGWENYEYRWGCGLTPHNQLKFPIPQWQGNSHPGEKLIVYGGEGLGDALQFCRYLPLLAKAGIDVTFFCRSKLVRLMRGLIPQVRCVDDLGPYERFDSQIALSSLPFAFRTDLTTIPNRTPYLAAEPALVSKWTERLMSRGNSAAFKIGLCWQGNLDPKADPSRSIPLAHFAPLAATKNFRLISLQKGEGAAALAAVPELAIEMLGADFDAGPDAFIDTAAVMQTLDLIITCDTSVAQSRRRLGASDLSPAQEGVGLALDARPRRYALVSDHAALPSAHARRLGRDDAARRGRRQSLA